MSDILVTEVPAPNEDDSGAELTDAPPVRGVGVDKDRDRCFSGCQSVDVTDHTDARRSRQEMEDDVDRRARGSEQDSDRS